MGLNRRYWFAAGLALLVAALLLIFVDPEQVYQHLRQANWSTLAAGTFFLLAGYLLLAVRWHVLLGTTSSFSQAFHANNIGNLLASLTPVPNSPIRAWLISRIGAKSLPQVTSGTAVERLLEHSMRIAALGVVILIGYELVAYSGSIWLSAGLILVLLFALLWVSRHADQVSVAGSAILARLPRLDGRRARHILVDLVTGLRQAGTPARMVSAWALTFLMWACFLTFQVLVLQALQVELALPQMLGIALVAMIVAPPSAPVMPGFYHAALVGSLSLIAGFGLAQMTAYALVLHFLQMACLLVLALWGLARVRFSVERAL